MNKLDVIQIGTDLYLIVQASHLLDLPSTVIVPVLPRLQLPGLRKLAVDIEIADHPYRINTHMPVTVDSARIRSAKVIHQISPKEGEMVMTGLYTILWGL